MYIILIGWISDFGNLNGALLGLISAAFSIGAVIAIPVVPYINDMFGRKHSITLGSVALLTGVIFQTASINIAIFLVAHIPLGTGIPFCINGASQLIAELTYPRHTSVLNGFLDESWYVGAIIAAGVTRARSPCLTTGHGESRLCCRSPRPCFNSRSSGLSPSPLDCWCLVTAAKKPPEFSSSTTAKATETVRLWQQSSQRSKQQCEPKWKAPKDAGSNYSKLQATDVAL